MRAASARTRVLPVPAGALITDTSRPSASAASAAAAWPSRSPVSVGCACVSGAAPVSALSRCARSAPSACAACSRASFGGVEDRDRFGRRDRQVEEQRALPRFLDGLGAELVLAFGGGMRLGRQQRGVQVGGFAAVARRAAELSAIGRFALAEQQIVRLALDGLAGLETERSGTGAPPAAGRFSPGLAGLDVIADRVLGRAAVNLLPDVVKVIALAQGCDNRQRLIHRQRVRRDCPCSSHGAWV